MSLIDTVREQRTKVLADADAIVAAAEAEARDLTDAEFDSIKEARATADKYKAQLDELAAIAEARDAAVPARKINEGGAKVISEARTYSKESDPTGGQFLADVIAGQLSGDWDARERLGRHITEERIERFKGREIRAVGTSAFAGLTVPQYLTELVAPDAKAGRPLANICNAHPLPASGMTVNISKITTASSTAVQTQNSASSETNMDDTLLTIDVLTIAGQQTVSRQAIERGTGIEDTVLADLFGEYHTTLDSTLINQATTGLDAITDGALDIAYTDASPTAAEAWPKMFDAIQQIQTAVNKGADAIVMHPRRFWWFAAQVGTSFPFVNLTGAQNQAGGSVATTGYGMGPSGYLAGLPVYVDANIVTNGGGGTNEDRIYILTRSECHLWEDSVQFIRAEQTPAASLGVLLVVYGYMAYTFNRYASANARIAGTGLATPAF